MHLVHPTECYAIVLGPIWVPSVTADRICFIYKLTVLSCRHFSLYPAPRSHHTNTACLYLERGCKDQIIAQTRTKSLLQGPPSSTSMGNKSSLMLRAEEIAQIQEETGCKCVCVCVCFRYFTRRCVVVIICIAQSCFLQYYPTISSNTVFRCLLGYFLCQNIKY